MKLEAFVTFGGGGGGGRGRACGQVCVKLLRGTDWVSTRLSRRRQRQVGRGRDAEALRPRRRRNATQMEWLSMVDDATRSDAWKLWLPDEQYGEALGAFLALEAQLGDAILLHGELGAGKTSCARGYIRCFVGDADCFVTSPTYLMDNAYPDCGNSILEGVTVHHMDLWRLKDTESRAVADFSVLFTDCVSLIEWPDRLSPSDMPKEHLDIYLEIYGTGRLVYLVSTGRRWQPEIKRIRDACVHRPEYPSPVLPPEAVV